ncbi:MAG: phosphodiesterase [Rhodospirillales bacterium]|nr:MAG: phosphodiesterase [Rhodospirillales bacterium]
MHVKPRGEMLSGALDSYASMARTVDRLISWRPQPDLLVATGDLTADGKPEEYAALRDLMADVGIPYLLIPGNHDDRQNLRAAFADQPWEDGPYLVYATNDQPLRIVALDTLMPGQHQGNVCVERCRWLDQRLAEQPDRPTILLMHHPPFATGIGHLDRMGLIDPSGLEHVVARHGQIVRILCGHIHRPISTVFAGVPASVAPATSFQIQLKLDDSKGIAWTREPPAFQLHSWSEDRGLLTHTAYVEDYGIWERPQSYRRMERNSGLA